MSNKYALALPQLTLMRMSILSLYSDPARLTIPPASSPLAYTSILSLPIPSETNILSPTLRELIPLVLAIQQYTLGCIFRIEMTSKEIGQRAALVSKALSSPGNALEWRRKFDESKNIPGGETDEKSIAELEVVNKRIDSMMTSMFGTLTKGCIGADTFAGEFFAH